MFALEQVALSALTVSLVISFFIPVLTGLATKYTTSSGLKGLITLVLNAVQTLIVTATMADGSAVISKETLIAFLLSLAVSVAIYTGIYKPLLITSSHPAGKLAPEKGI